jgi:hypothetical protein
MLLPRVSAAVELHKSSDQAKKAVGTKSRTNVKKRRPTRRFVVVGTPTGGCCAEAKANIAMRSQA